MKLERGTVLKSGNFVLVSRIEDINELILYLKNNKSIFWRRRNVPISFYFASTIDCSN